MFFRCRARRRFFRFLLMLLGIRILTQNNHMTDAEREAYKTKAKTFRKKMREAFEVWDTDETTHETSTEEKL